MSLELETLDQLAGGDMSLAVVRRIFGDDPSFLRSIHALLREGDVRLLNNSGSELPQWQWRELFVEGLALKRLSEFQLSLTPRGASKV